MDSVHCEIRVEIRGEIFSFTSDQDG